jgi:hypothetical protein
MYIYQEVAVDEGVEVEGGHGHAGVVPHPEGELSIYIYIVCI